MPSELIQIVNDANYEEEDQFPYMGASFDSISGFFKNFILAPALQPVTKTAIWVIKCYGAQKALSNAVRNDNSFLVDLCIKAGADVNVQYGNILPLSSARSVGIVESLIAAGADVNAKDYVGPVLHSAEKVDIIKVLLAAGADVNACDNFGRTALHKATKAEQIKALLAGGADVRTRDRSGETALHSCVHLNEDDAIKALIAAGAEVDASNYQGETSLNKFLLFFAHRSDRDESIQALIDEGANAHIKNSWNVTAISIGLNTGSDNIKSLLQDKRTKHKIC